MDEQERNIAASTVFSILYGDFSKEEHKFINDVLVGVKERSDGNTHVSFDFDELIKDKNKGKSVKNILDETFYILDKLQSGKIKGKPYTDNVERSPISDYIKE